MYQLPTDYPEVCNAPLWTYLVADGDLFALIDPGIRSTLAATLDAAVREVGFDPSSADLLVATHGHPDHSGGQSSWLGTAPLARIAAPLADTPWVESFDHQWTRFWDDYPGTLDLSGTRDFLASLCVPEPRVGVLLRDGDTVTVGDRVLDVIERAATPGATAPCSTGRARRSSLATPSRGGVYRAVTASRCSLLCMSMSVTPAGVCRVCWISHLSGCAPLMCRPWTGSGAWISCGIAWPSSIWPTPLLGSW